MFYIDIICGYMFRPLLPIFRRKYIITILGNYLNYNGSLGFYWVLFGQSSWLQIQRPGFDSRHYHILWEVVGLERGPPSLVSTTEELLEIKSSGSGLENREYGRRDSSRWSRGTLYPQKLAQNSLTSGGRSVGIVRSRTQATEFSLVSYLLYMLSWPI
jgi:hypothetical protein